MLKRFIVVASCILELSSSGYARASQSDDERGIQSLGDTFAHAFVTKNAPLRASIFADDATLLTPQGVFLQGRAAMIKDFGPEAEALVTPRTKAAFSHYRFRFVTSDIAFVDTDLTVNNVRGPNRKLLAVMPIKVAFVAVRDGRRWLIKDERAWVSAH